MNAVDPKTRREYIKIATSYYKLGMTQDDIAKKFCISRQKVNRVLKQCVDMGIVKISIMADESHNTVLENQIEDLFGLKEVFVVESESNIYEDIGKAAVTYFQRIIKDNDIIGFSRGRTILALLNNLDNVTAKGLFVCQLAGGNNYQEEFNNNDSIVHKAAEKLKARAYHLHAPTVLSSSDLKKSLLKEESFKKTYKVLKACTIAIVGIGPTFLKGDVERKSRITDEDYAGILERGAVGEICARHYDIAGRSVNGEVDEKIMGIEPEDFKQIPVRVGMAGGHAKLNAILGAIRGNYINVLIIDIATAMELLEKGKDHNHDQN